MTGNWIEINGIQIAVPDGLLIATNSPLEDSSFLYVNGNKISETGEQGFEIELNVSADQLPAIGMPQLLQKSFVKKYINNVSLYSDGTLVTSGSIFITSTDYNDNTKTVKCQGLFFNFASAFVNAITTRRVNQLNIGGVRVIDGMTDYLTGPTLPDPSVRRAPSGYTTSDYPIWPQTDFNIANSADRYGTATADYAAQVTLNGDPGADDNGDILCFPPYMVIDSSNGNTLVNGWDPVNHFYPSVYTQEDTSGVFDNPNYYQDLGAHIVPMYYYHQIIRHCFSDFGYTLHDPDRLLEDAHLRRLVMVNNFDILNAVTIARMNMDKTVTTTVGYWQRTTLISPANHLPADLILDFLKDFMVKFNCYFDIGTDTAILRRGKFKGVAREIKDYDPHFSIHPTLESGMTASYTLTEDKQFANIPMVPDMCIYGTDVRPFDAGFNKVYTYPEGDPLTVVISPPVPDLHYAILNLSNNTLNYRIAGSPPFSYTQLLTTDNVLPITIGVDTREDSPSVNLLDANTNQPKSISLLYPPISQVSAGSPAYNNPAVVVAPVSDTPLWWPSGYGIDPHITIDAAGETGALGLHVAWGPKTISVVVAPQLILPIGHFIILSANIVTDSLGRSGSFRVYGTVTSYNNATGQLVFSSGSYDFNNTGGLSSTWLWNKWTLSYDLAIMPSVGGVPALMQVPISAFRTPELLFQVGSIGARPQDVGLIQQTWDTSIWSIFPNSATMMPGTWSKRSGSAVFELGFYWGIQQTYQPTTLDPPPYYVPADTIPVLTGVERIIGNPDIAPGWFNLSLHGPYSLPVIFWTPFLNQYVNNVKVNFIAHESLRTTMGHNFSQCVLWRGRRIYISQVDKNLPYRGAGVAYQGYII